MNRESAAPPASKERFYIIVAALLSLFLSALDTLVMGAAMPTIVAELGGLHLYSWVFSSYMLSRAVALPVFGKLSDLYSNRTLYTIAVLIFLAGSTLAGISRSMAQLTIFRVIQGIGAGGIFALVYIVLADISKPEDRGKNDVPGEPGVGAGQRAGADLRRIHRGLSFLAMDLFHQYTPGCRFVVGDCGVPQGEPG